MNHLLSLSHSLGKLVLYVQLLGTHAFFLPTVTRVPSSSTKTIIPSAPCFLFSPVSQNTGPGFQWSPKIATIRKMGSIYAPDGKDSEENDEEGDGSQVIQRDHLGMKRSSGGMKPISNWATASSTNTKNESDSSKEDATSLTEIQKAVEEAVLQANQLQGMPLQNNSDEIMAPKTRGAPSPTVGKVPVRFINFDTMGGLERLAYAVPGTNILKIADEAGIRIPRQCRSGLCGSCTADVKDPTWTSGDRIGYQTIRTCQAGAMLPAGCEEMVIDCYRVAPDSMGKSTLLVGEVGSMPKRPPSNFDDGWEADFVPDYKTKRSSSNSGVVSVDRAGGPGGGRVQVVKTTTPEYIVKEGRASSIEIDKPHWTPRVDANIPPWETIW